MMKSLNQKPIIRPEIKLWTWDTGQKAWIGSWFWWWWVLNWSVIWHDSEIDLIKAFNNKARVSLNESHPRVSNEHWKELSAQQSRAWSKLSSKAKIIILGAQTSSQPRTNLPTSQASLSNRTIHLIQISTSDLISPMHDWQFISEEGSNNKTPSTKYDELSVHVTQRKPLAPGNIRQVKKNKDTLIS